MKHDIIDVVAVLAVTVLMVILLGMEIYCIIDITSEFTYEINEADHMEILVDPHTKIMYVTYKKGICLYRSENGKICKYVDGVIIEIDDTKGDDE